MGIVKLIKFVFFRPVKAMHWFFLKGFVNLALKLNAFQLKLKPIKFDLCSCQFYYNSLIIFVFNIVCMSIFYFFCCRCVLYIFYYSYVNRGGFYRSHVVLFRYLIHSLLNTCIGKFTWTPITLCINY